MDRLQKKISNNKSDYIYNDVFLSSFNNKIRNENIKKYTLNFLENKSNLKKIIFFKQQPFQHLQIMKQIKTNYHRLKNNIISFRNFDYIGQKNIMNSFAQIYLNLTKKNLEKTNIIKDEIDIKNTF